LNFTASCNKRGAAALTMLPKLESLI